MTQYNPVPPRIVGRGTIKVSPIRTKRPERDYTRLERYRRLTLHPGNWGGLLSDDSPLGAPWYVGRG